MKRTYSIAVIVACLLFTAGCETFNQVEDQILGNASNAVSTVETGTP